MPAPIRTQVRARPLRLEPPDDDLVAQALRRLQDRLSQPGQYLGRPQLLHDFLRLQLAAEPAELMVGVFLDSKQRLIAHEVLFRGSLRQVPVYVREIIRRCLEHNAAGLVLAHNHPSGEVQPSSADRKLIGKVRAACEMLEITLVDSLIVGGDSRLMVHSAAQENWS